MLSIRDGLVLFNGDKWIAECICGKVNLFASKDKALKSLARQNCRYCQRDYRSMKDAETGIYQRADGRWCSACSGCGKEQAYTRKDHAKQSEISDWQCKVCVAKAKGFENNRKVGDKQRLFSKFKKSAENRGIDWNLSIEDMFAGFAGRCALTDWPISIAYHETTASLDRIDSSEAYTANNIQWVHVMVNMCKNKFDQAKFIQMCNAVADKVKW